MYRCYLFLLTLPNHAVGQRSAICPHPDSQGDQARSRQVGEVAVREPVDPVEDPEVGVQLIDMAQDPGISGAAFPTSSTMSLSCPQ